MPTRIVPFTTDLLPTVARFSRKMWTRPVDDAYLRWRYLECPAQLGYLAVDDAGECVAMIWAFRRPYRIGDRRVVCLETCDWFTLPELRTSLLGVRVMRALMQNPEIIVAVGGSAHTLGLLPSLRWNPVGQVTQFVLPLEGIAVGQFLERRLGIPAGRIRSIFRGTARHWFAADVPVSMPGGQVQRGEEITPDLVQLHDQESGYALLPAIDPDLTGWLMRSPASLGEMVLLRFLIWGRLMGWSLSRVHESPAGRDATILEVFAPGTEPAVHEWLVSETVDALRKHQPDSIHATASAEPLRRALRRRRFMKLRDMPVHVWRGTDELTRLPLHIGNNTSDAPIFPYPTEAPSSETVEGSG